MPEKAPPPTYLALVAGTALAAVALLAFVGPGSAAPTAVPSNNHPPSISGLAQEGHQLTASHGDWSDDPTDYDYQWQRCNSSGSGCSDITGEADNDYTLGSADVGNRIRVGVNASNSNGTSDFSYSDTTDVVSAAGSAPSNTSPPTISGTPRDNETLSASPGNWNGSAPIEYTYMWRRCDSSGGNCADITKGQEYEATSRDVGHRLRVAVTATNSVGSSSAVSTTTGIVAAAGAAPKNNTIPAITGTAQDNQTLTASLGTWTSSTAITFTRDWKRCDSNGNSCQSISGSDQATYESTSSDVGHRLRIAVTGKNAFGSSTATSNPTAVVAAAGPAGAIKLPNGTTSIPITAVSPPDRLVVDKVEFHPSTIGSRNEQVLARFRVVDSNGYVVRDALVYAIGVPSNRVTVPTETKTDQSGWATLAYKPKRGLPLKNGARLTIFVRARKPGGSILGGVSTRRLVSIGVHPTG